MYMPLDGHLEKRKFQYVGKDVQSFFFLNKSPKLIITRLQVPYSNEVMITAVLCSRNFSKFRLSETRNFTLLLRNFVSKRNSVSSKLKFLSFRHQISFRRIYHLPCQISTSLKQYFAAFPSETKVRNLLISLSLLLHSTVDSF